jgi:formylmethanofuran:tetrahydromethanopterin formyltransferase
MCTQEERAFGREIITLGVYRPQIVIEDALLLSDLVRVSNLFIFIPDSD